MNNKSFLVSLNFFRAFSGYGVCISHYFFHIYDLIFFEYLSFIFVEFFFVLSGYVLAPQLMNINSKETIKIFFIRRWVRTIPLFIMSIFLYSYFLDQFNIDTLKHLFLIQNVVPNFVNLNYIPVLWSLSVEEYFYLLFPLVLFFNKDKDFFNILIFVIVLFFILIFFFSFVMSTSELRTNTFLRLDSIVYGVALYVLNEKKINIKTNIVLLLFFIPLFYYYFNLQNKNFNFLDSFFFLVFLKIFSVYACNFFIKQEIHLSPHMKISKFLANQVYSMYLFHLLVIYILKDLLLNGVLVFVIYLFSIFIFSTLIYNYFEKPLNNNRPKFPNKKRIL
jgi:peptidoglycan/LPS O-acetylase OafA/YrhL